MSVLKLFFPFFSRSSEFKIEKQIKLNTLMLLIVESEFASDTHMDFKICNPSVTFALFFLRCCATIKSNLNSENKKKHSHIIQNTANVKEWLKRIYAMFCFVSYVSHIFIEIWIKIKAIQWKQFAKQAAYVALMLYTNVFVYVYVVHTRAHTHMSNQCESRLKVQRIL